MVGDPRGGKGSDYSEKITISLPVFAPDFAIVSLDILPPTPEGGDALVIRATVQNQGTASGTGSVEFLVDGIQLESKSLTLQPGREKTVSAVWSAVEGNHTIRVRVSVAGDPDSGNGGVDRMISVAGSPQKKESDEEIPVLYLGGAALAAAAAVIGGVLVHRKRQAGVGRCPKCGGEARYSKEENDYYCWECEEYVGEMENGKEEMENGKEEMEERVIE